MGILAHVDAGKTTLSEGILYLTGGLRKLGRVDHGDAFLDNFALERSRGITIFPSRRCSRWERRKLRSLIRRDMWTFLRRWSGRSGSWITQCWW